MENILIRAFIYPIFQSQIEKNKESKIYKYFNFEGGWAGFNIIENNEELSISKNAAEWWTYQLGHAFRQQYDISSSQKMNR